MRQAIFVWLMASSVCLAEPVSLRAPAVPLVTHDPYFSIWSAADRLTDCETTHWTGRPHPLRGTVRVDGQLFRVMGLQPTDAAALPQTERDGLAHANRLSVCQRSSETHADVSDAGVAVGPGSAGPAGDLHHVGDPVCRRPAARRSTRIQPGRRIGGEHGRPAGDLGSADRGGLHRAAGRLARPAYLGTQRRRPADRMGLRLPRRAGGPTAGSHRRGRDPVRPGLGRRVRWQRGTFCWRTTISTRSSILERGCVPTGGATARRRPTCCVRQNAITRRSLHRCQEFDEQFAESTCSASAGKSTRRCALWPIGRRGPATNWRQMPTACRSCSPRRISPTAASAPWMCCSRRLRSFSCSARR